MITLVFPTPEAMLAASEFMPTPTEVSRRAEGIIITTIKPTRTIASKLAKLGVSAGIPHADAPRIVSSWAEAIPLSRSNIDPELVMFRIPLLRLSSVVAEVKRISECQNMAFANVDETSFLRVDKPPYYTLLKEISYVEQFPNVWIRTGFKHIGKIQAPKGKMLFVDEDRWEEIDDFELRNINNPIFEIKPLEFAVSSDKEDSIKISVQLCHSSSAEKSTFWMIDGKELPEFLTNANEATVSKLQYAFAGEKVVIRTINNREKPPVLGVSGYKTYFMSNLFVPVGFKIFPTLRRDILRKVLSPNPKLIYWMVPDKNKKDFRPESIPEEIFAPLIDYVDYTVPEQKPILSHETNDLFEFPHFVTDSEEPGSVIKSPSIRKRSPVHVKSQKEDIVVKLPEPKVEDLIDLKSVVREPSEWENIRKELEEKFIAIEGPIDEPSRCDMWLPLARANIGQGDVLEASICYLQSIWYKFDNNVVSEWANSEFGQIPNSVSGLTPRQFAVALLSNPNLINPSTILEFEKVEKHLSPRLIWLVARVLFKDDTLALARTRDRILNRLLEGGLVAEQELPFFLRVVGTKDATRTSQIASIMDDTYQAIRSWVEKGLTNQSENGKTVGYIDMMFAWAFGKLGKLEHVNSLVAKAKKILFVEQPKNAQDLAATVLFQAFEHRVRQVINEVPAGELPPELFVPLKTISNSEYPVGRMRKESFILDPDNTVDPYFSYYRGSDFSKKIAALSTSENLEHDISVLYSTKTIDAKMEVLAEAIPIVMLKSEELTHKLISLVPDAIRGRDNKSSGVGLSVKQGKMIERALFAAAHFDQKDNIKMLAQEFATLIRQRPEEKLNLVNIVAGQCFQSLRKLGMKDDVGNILELLQKEIIGGKTLNEFQDSAKNDWNKNIQTLLVIANGWSSITFSDRAVEILNMAEKDLLSDKARNSEEYTLITNAYVSACGQNEATLDRIVRFFGNVSPSKVSNGFTTAPHYSRFHIKIAEQTVLAILGDNSIGGESQRWLDDGEYLLRQSVHQDVRKALEEEKQ